MSTWKSDRIATNGIHIHYVRTGGEKPPVVLAHGFSDDGLCWTPVAERLAAAYDVIMFDARGHGRSAAPESGYSPVEMATDLAGVITGLGLHKPAVLGHSMGGAMTYVMAGTYPELPGAILIEDSGVRNLASGATADAAERQRQARERMQKLQQLDRADLIAQGRADNPAWSDAELEPWADAKLRFNLNALKRMGTVVENWEEILRGISCPALLITADVEKGAIVSAEDAVALQALIPQLEVVNIPGAGHSVRREQFERYMAVVEEFLSKVTPTA